MIIYTFEFLRKADIHMEFLLGIWGNWFFSNQLIDSVFEINIILTF